MIARTLQIFCRCTLLAVLLLASFVALLYVNPALRHSWFSQLCARMQRASSPEMRQLRCDLLADVRGQVLEIGFGPGANLDCYLNNSKIESLIGLEPNVEFSRLSTAACHFFDT